MSSPIQLSAPNRITASNLPLRETNSSKPHSEPAVEVRVDKLEVEPIMGGGLRRARVASSTKLPTSNDGHLSNRTNEWVRLIAMVVASEPNRVSTVESGHGDQPKTVVLNDEWLQ
ncbi:hypothetical protein F5Y00DRAFT_262485 [Daldinia vernicosa]|uniref:uncharacterized protein n=1 Tax=Daldinia vernicosa TaxID=114800 RepID=UPI0020083898|nr:uncharacterized protein F5Y00DRAFT_262485 [Daldinia vernicosa]KAI0848393.1 hypothetical protein F5Y00DRAFT_262485 [Daldinia vernicosa]